MRVFLDTNVLFSGLYSPRGAPNAILEKATSGTIDVVVSADVLAELVRNIARKAPYLAADLNVFLRDTSPEVVEPSKEEAERRYDAGFGSDAPIVAAALAAGVDYFCTGDRRLLARHKLGEAPVVSPAELLRLLE